MKYKYKFVTVELKQGFSITLKPAEDYHAIIDKHADEGWRFVQIFAPATYGTGAASYFEMIFERPED